MKRHLFFLILLVTAFVTGCSKDDTRHDVPVTEVRLDKETVTLNVGETAQLKATVLPDNADSKTVTWSSDDKSVATVSEAGLVTAIARGEATITATAGGKKAICRVTVSDAGTGLEKDENITAYFDPDFARVLERRGYIPDATFITVEDVQDIDSIYVYYGELTSLRGIEYFTKLKKLYCHYNQLTSLDLSNNTELIGLYCDNNQLTSLNVSNNTKLTELTCYNNLLTSLDVSNNTELKALGCGGNQLTSLDVSNNTKLTGLVCWSNQLTSLDISNNTKLTDLDCSSNRLTSLDVSNNTELTDLDCSYNQLTSLNISNNTELTELYCWDNQLTSLDISNNTRLTRLNCSDNQLTSLDISNNTELTGLYCYNNQLTSLDVSNNTELTFLNFYNNPGTNGKFPVTAWFDNSDIPEKFTTGSWDYNGQSVEIDYNTPHL